MCSQPQFDSEQSDYDSDDTSNASRRTQDQATNAVNCNETEKGYESDSSHGSIPEMLENGDPRLDDSDEDSSDSDWEEEPEETHHVYQRTRNRTKPRPPTPTSTPEVTTPGSDAEEGTPETQESPAPWPGDNERIGDKMSLPKPANTTRFYAQNVSGLNLGPTATADTKLNAIKTFQVDHAMITEPNLAMDQRKTRNGIIRKCDLIFGRNQHRTTTASTPI